MSDPLEQYRNAHKGARCFLLGSGPSIAQQDLTRLADEITFCSNLFIQHPQIQQLQPTYYCAYDPGLVTPVPNPRWLSLLRALPEMVCFLADTLKDLLPPLPSVVHYLRFNADSVMDKEMPVDPGKGLVDGGSVMVNFCLPLAAYMGFQRIYLLGCECNYGIADSGNRDHAYFYNKDQHVDSFHDAPSERKWQHRVLRSFEIAAKTLKEQSIEVYNATPGGLLEAFPRVAFEKVIA